MAQRSLAETLTGAVVLVVAVGFLGYAVANTGRTPVSGYSLHAASTASTGWRWGPMCGWPA